MLTEIIFHGAKQAPAPREGDLYKEVTVSDKTFRLVYGYYENFERDIPFNEPMPIYPNLIEEPHYTPEGLSIVTAMQNVCKFYKGKKDEDSSCSDCGFFQISEDLFGLCNCPQNKRCCKERVDVKNE